MDFNPLPPHGGRHLPTGCLDDARDFNPLPPHGGRRYVPEQTRCSGNFNPLPPHGGRRSNYCPWITGLVFQSTPSAWRETKLCEADLQHQLVFQSTPSAWRETFHGFCPPVNTIISIHSLRMEGDLMALIHAIPDIVFQSTPSAWRETYAMPSHPQHWTNFNPLPPHGGRHAGYLQQVS